MKQTGDVKNAGASARPVRIGAIDALRGMDMFWITGGLPLFLAFCRLFSDPLPAWLAFHADHRPWAGFAAWDLVMPLFLFIVGAAMPFSFAKYTGQGKPGWRVYAKILRRFLLLFVLGMVAQGNLLSFNPDRIALFSNTLQAIAGGYLIAALALLHLKTRGRVVLLFALLAGYWALLRFMPFGGFAGGTIEPGCNIALYWDRLLQGRHQDGTNYTWILTQPAFGAMTLCGVLGGEVLKSLRFSPLRKVALLCGAGVLALALGYVWSLDLEVIKRLFTSSMVLWAAGWCFLLLALFYLVNDIFGWERLFFPFKVIGSNAIFVYMWVEVCPPTRNLSAALFGGFSRLFGGGETFVFLLCNYGLVWCVLYFLYRQKVFLKV